jgi:type II pantothenate kinase
MKGTDWIGPFVGGAVSASLLWYVFTSLHHQQHEEVNDEEEDNLSLPTQLQYIFMSSVDDFTSRIGELPRRIIRKTQWPWRTLGRRRKQADIDNNQDNNGTNKTVVKEKTRNRTNDEENDNDELSNSSSLEEINEDDDDGRLSSVSSDKSGFCIGSIFGLDVGGTLAKLVYFEETSQPHEPGGSCGVGVVGTGSTSTENGFAANTLSGSHHRHSFSATSSATDLGAWHALAPTGEQQSRILRMPQLDEDEPSNDANGREGSQSVLRKSHSDEFLSTHKVRPSPDHYYGRSVAATKITSTTTDANLPTQSASSASLPKIHSMLDLQFNNHHDRQQALEKFYQFAQHLDYRDHQLRFYSRELGGYFHFVHFETRRMKEAMDLIRKHNLQRNIRNMGATGGGAHKFAKDFSTELGITMQREGELESLVAGMQFVLSTVVGECYSFRPPNEKKPEDRQRVPHKVIIQEDKADYGDYFGVNYWKNESNHRDEKDDEQTGNGDTPHSSNDEKKNPRPEQPNRQNTSMKVDDWWWSRKVQRDSISYSSTYPYLVVTIGTGVSILRVDGPRKHERISGSTIGGGTYWGLIRLLTSYEKFGDVMRLAERGDPSKVDMMVGDIYGGNSDALDRLGLRADLVASSFGKLVAKEDPAEGLTEEDLARALLLMVTNNIGQVAYLNAELHNTERIYFVGNFLRENRLSQRRLAFAIDYWSKGKMEALFLEHEGYFGALGAFLLSQGIPHQEKHRKVLQSQHSTPLPTEVTPPRHPLRRRQTFETFSFASND